MWALEAIYYTPPRGSGRGGGLIHDLTWVVRVELRGFSEVFHMSHLMHLVGLFRRIKRTKIRSLAVDVDG